MQVLVDEFDLWYNTTRRHQGLTRCDGDGRRYRMTPQQAWEATTVVAPPQPLTPVVPVARVAAEPCSSQFDALHWADNLQQSLRPGTTGVTSVTRVSRAANGTAVRTVEDSGYTTRNVSFHGYASFRGVRFQMGYRHRGGEVKVAWDPETIVFADLDGTVIVIHEHPPAGTTYVSNGLPQGRPRKPTTSQDDGEVLPKS